LEPTTKSDLRIDDTRHFAGHLRMGMDGQAMGADCGDWASRC
jgi:hypothetical protein